MKHYFRNMLFSLLVALPVVYAVAETLPPDDGIIYWTKTHRLAFTDFRGKPAQADTALQAISEMMRTHKLGSIVKSIDVQVVTQRGKTIFTIRAGMKRNLSWIKDAGDTVSLKHEQGHFDICEIYARMLRRDIKKSKSLAEARDFFEKASAAEELEQDNYDKDNTFQSGGITVVWQEKIRNRLKELEAYENTMVVLPIDK